MYATSASAKLPLYAAAAARALHASATRRAATLDVPPIFDIFNVPPRLALRAEHRTPRPHARAAAPRGPLHPRVPDRLPLPHSLPTSLPDPLVFDGPARRRPVVRTHQELAQQEQRHPVAALYAPDAVVTMFDGPAHSRRHSQWQRPLAYQSSTPHGRSHRNGLHNLQLTAAAAAATVFTFGVANSWFGRLHCVSK
ncbi:hypothetical protein GGX14DRAFT_565499 [Mycena pura]|uniref:Uncharacterized protein n=1 Tax=Mycena pura TaxID=153505 RepID=A0AAD6VMG6_9AGAR|nr:hypothetical protein GGX14DRAFT_565499 [Mycena pura]